MSGESFFSVLMDGGFIMYPLFLVAAAVIGFAVSGARQLGRLPQPADAGAGTARDPRLEATIDGVMFWGVFAVVLGVLGTLIGIVQAARAIERAGSVSASLAWGGIRVSLISTIFALLLFSIAALVWFALRRVYAKRRAMS